MKIIWVSLYENCVVPAARADKTWTNYSTLFLHHNSYCDVSKPIKNTLSKLISHGVERRFQFPPSFLSPILTVQFWSIFFLVLELKSNITSLLQQSSSYESEHSYRLWNQLVTYWNISSTLKWMLVLSDGASYEATLFLKSMKMCIYAALHSWWYITATLYICTSHSWEQLVLLPISACQIHKMSFANLL